MFNLYYNTTLSATNLNINNKHTRGKFFFYLLITESNFIKEMKRNQYYISKQSGKKTMKYNKILFNNI